MPQFGQLSKGVVVGETLTERMVLDVLSLARRFIDNADKILGVFVLVNCGFTKAERHRWKAGRARTPIHTPALRRGATGATRGACRPDAPATPCTEIPGTDIPCTHAGPRPGFLLPLPLWRPRRPSP
jgi:hypothetical protein